MYRGLEPSWYMRITSYRRGSVVIRIYVIYWILQGSFGVCKFEFIPRPFCVFTHKQPNTVLLSVLGFSRCFFFFQQFIFTLTLPTPATCSGRVITLDLIRRAGLNIIRLFVRYFFRLLSLSLVYSAPQIPGPRWHRRLNAVQWYQTFVGLQYRSCSCGGPFRISGF